MTEPNRPQSTVHQPVQAAVPASSRARWAELIGSSHTPRGWAVIAAAIQTADSAKVDAFGEALVRGSEDWCRVAITATEAPTTANATAATVPDQLPDRCLYDGGLLRAWLSAPAAYADSHVATVADLVADRDFSQTADETTQEGLQRLVDAAQDAGVYGVHGYRIELHGVTGEDGWISRQLLVARPAAGPGLVGELVDRLVPTVAVSGVDSALAVLSRVAREVNTILDGFDGVLQRAGATGRGRSASSAFPPPRGGGGPTTDEPAGPQPPRRPGPARRR